MRKFVLPAAVAATLLGVAATPGFASDALYVPVAPGYSPYRQPPVIGKQIAERIAHSQGLMDVDDVDQEGPNWVVTGTDVREDDITVTVNAQTGRVVDVKPE